MAQALLQMPMHCIKLDRGEVHLLPLPLLELEMLDEMMVGVS